MRTVVLLILAGLCLGCAAAPPLAPGVVARRDVALAGWTFRVAWQGREVRASLLAGPAGADDRALRALGTAAIEAWTDCAAVPASIAQSGGEITLLVDCSAPGGVSI